MSEYIHKRHHVTVLLYHIVLPAKYRRVVFDNAVDIELKQICLAISERYQVKFLEIGTDKDHVHFLVQSVPTYSVTRLIMLIKSLTAREIFRRCPQVKKQLWGGEFWTDGYCPNLVLESRPKWRKPTLAAGTRRGKGLSYSAFQASDATHHPLVVAACRHGQCK